MGNMEINMASTKVGAEIVQKPASIVRGEFPNLIINRKASRWVQYYTESIWKPTFCLFYSQDGWISPRVRGRQAEETEFTVIKLAGKAEIDRIAVDTVHFIGNAPKKVVLEGCCVAAPQVNLILICWPDQSELTVLTIGRRQCRSNFTS